MENENNSQVVPNDGKNASSFVPMLYKFRVAPGNNTSFVPRQPFAILFDNLIAVLWYVYGEKSTTQIGINQLKWALEFLKCMRADYDYPESIKKIVNELEDQLIQLYAKVGEKIREGIRKKEMEQYEMDKEKNSKTSKTSTFMPVHTSYNESDIMKKLDMLNVPLDPSTGEAKYLKELNLLGSRKSKNQDKCANSKKSSKTHVINALQKILNKTSEVTTKVGVEELIKELKVEESSVTQRSTKQH